MTDIAKPLNDNLMQTFAFDRGQRAIVKRGDNPEDFTPTKTRQEGYIHLGKVAAAAVGIVGIPGVVLGYGIHQLNNESSIDLPHPTVQQQQERAKNLVNLDTTVNVIQQAPTDVRPQPGATIAVIPGQK
jgi:hypothetical protein